MTHLEIEAFLAICKHKTISKAATELFISQSTLSERLKTLEGKLNHTLLLRRKGIREITLTPEGHTFYKLALQYQELIVLAQFQYQIMRIEVFFTCKYRHR